MEIAPFPSPCSRLPHTKAVASAKNPSFSPAAKHLSVRRRVLVSLSPGPFPTLNLSSTANVNATAASVHTMMMTNRFLFLSTSPHGWMGEWMQGYAPVTPRRPTPHQTQEDGIKKLRYPERASYQSIWSQFGPWFDDVSSGFKNLAGGGGGGITIRWVSCIIPNSTPF